MKLFDNAAVAAIFDAYPDDIRERLLFLRTLIFEVAQADGVGELEETIKWGEPAYLTKSKSGSTIRINRKKSSDTQYAMYFNCQTSLVDTFRTLFPSAFRYEGNRSIVFDVKDVIPVRELSFCIAMALNYHRQKSTTPH